ncbi:MAG: hypothetical protein GY862_13265 [Gammaproteobacteria bacterium]|nr:hypothetical protein [Gammaproteobacteria bacterium]
MPFDAEAMRRHLLKTIQSDETEGWVIGMGQPQYYTLKKDPRNIYAVKGVITTGDGQRGAPNAGFRTERRNQG